jgi:phage terminase large subunit
MRVPNAPVEIRLEYKPKPKQYEFHALAAKYKLFIGGWGNGKTSAGCAEAFTLAMEYPGCTGLVLRRTRPELKATTEPQLLNGGGGPSGDWTGIPEEVIRKHNKTDNLLELINGSKIIFWPADDPEKLSNLNLGWFLIDQAEEVSEEIFQTLHGRLRQANGPRVGILLANPNGHDWIWRRFVYLKYPDHKYVHAKTTDNDTLPKDYVESLMKMPKAWVERYVEGSFDVFSGQIFPEFDRNFHVISPFPMADWYEGMEGIDWGYRNPTSVLWTKFDDKGNCFVVDEHLEANRLVHHHAEKIHERRAEWGQPMETLIDPSSSKTDPTSGRSVIDEFNDHGILVTPADNARIAGINRIGEWMRLDPTHPHPITNEIHPMANAENPEDRRGWPRLYIFSNCVQLIEHLGQYQWKKKPPQQEDEAKEKPLEKDDHDVDALRYTLMRRPQPSVVPINYQPTKQDWYWKRIRERMDGKASGHAMLGSEA